MAIDYTKPQIKYIIIERAEGLAAECGQPMIRKTFAEAALLLRQMARTAPDAGGYDKCDFYVIWNDSETYRGRYDLQRDSDGDIRAQMLSFLTPDSASRMAKMMTTEQLEAGRQFVAERNF